MEGAVGAFFFRILEGAEALEAALTDEVEQVFEFGLAFAGMAHDERGAEDDAGNQGAHPGHQVARLPAVDAAPHHREDAVGAVLQRDVDVGADLRVVGHQAEHILRKAGGIAVVEPDPFDAVDLRELLQQAGQAAFSVAVEPVVGRVLGDDDEFLHALGGQAARLFHQIFHGHAHVRAADERNGAVGTGAVAAFRNLEIGIVRRCGEHPVQGIEVQDAFPAVHFGDFGRKFFAVALRQAAEHRNFAHAPLLLGLDGLQDRLDRFLLGVLDETAGVDDHFVDPAVGRIDVFGNKLIAALLQNA